MLRAVVARQTTKIATLRADRAAGRVRLDAHQAQIDALARHLDVLTAAAAC